MLIPVPLDLVVSRSVVKRWRDAPFHPFRREGRITFIEWAIAALPDARRVQLNQATNEELAGWISTMLELVGGIRGSAKQACLDYQTAGWDGLRSMPALSGVRNALSSRSDPYLSATAVNDPISNIPQPPASPLQPSLPGIDRAKTVVRLGRALAGKAESNRRYLDCIYAAVSAETNDRLAALTLLNMDETEGYARHVFRAVALPCGDVDTIMTLTRDPWSKLCRKAESLLFARQVPGCDEPDAPLRSNYSGGVYRPEQAQFRRAVLRAYAGRCAITGDTGSVDAAHIMPFTEDGPNDVRNGVLLRHDLHQSFDRLEWSFTTTYIIVATMAAPEAVRRLHGARIPGLPAIASAFPEALHVRWREQAFLKQGPQVLENQDHCDLRTQS